MAVSWAEGPMTRYVDSIGGALTLCVRVIYRHTSEGIFFLGEKGTTCFLLKITTIPCLMTGKCPLKMPPRDYHVPSWLFNEFFFEFNNKYGWKNSVKSLLVMYTHKHTLKRPQKPRSNQGFGKNCCPTKQTLLKSCGPAGGWSLDKVERQTRGREGAPKLLWRGKILQKGCPI